MCGCIQRIDAELKAAGHNTMLNTTLFGTPKAVVATVQRETGRGKKKAHLMLASYCPFCGERYPSPQATTPSQDSTAPASASPPEDTGRVSGQPDEVK